MTDVPLILIPGMGADERLFAPQREAFPNLIVPKWITPAPNDSIQSYAKRWALQIDPKRPCFVGGASFGGFVAMEMARHLQTLGVFLIGSLRGAEELPPKFRSLKPIRQFLSSLAASMKETDSTISQVAESDALFLRWASQAVLDWEPSPTSPTPLPPVFQIHGGADPVLSPRFTKPDEIIPNAGHLISLTHPTQVNAFLTKHMKS
jgi:pimeloyl-ACP methyl ester carboxylesterase